MFIFKWRFRSRPAVLAAYKFPNDCAMRGAISSSSEIKYQPRQQR